MQGPLNRDAALILRHKIDGGAGAQAVITIDPVEEETHVIDWIVAGYTGNGAGKLLITWGGTPKWEVPIPVGGPHIFEFGIRGLHNNTANEAVVLTLSAVAGETADLVTGYH